MDCGVLGDCIFWVFTTMARMKGQDHLVPSQEAGCPDLQNRDTSAL